MILGLVIVGMGYEIRKNNDSDFKVVTVDDSGIVIRSVSWQRRMVNELVVGKGVPVWVPEGMGWYDSDKIKKLLDQEKKYDLIDKLVFYNFGIVPDVTVFNSHDNWLYNAKTLRSWGLADFLRYLFSQSKMMSKREVLTENYKTDEGKMEEIMERDFADNRLLNEDLKLTIYNSSQSSGLANFMSKILEKAGFTVVGVDNYTGTVEGCKIMYGKGFNGTYGEKVLRREFNTCVFEENGSVNEKEVELYFEDSFSQMLNYPSYSP